MPKNEQKFNKKIRKSSKNSIKNNCKTLHRNTTKMFTIAFTEI